MRDRHRPLHLSWSNLAIVALGGAVGTGLRYVITLLVPRWAEVPIATLAINVTGAFLLGLLLELLADRSLDTGWSRRSALATETAALAITRPGLAIAYAFGTVLTGAAASIAGIWLSRGHLRPALVNGRNRR